MHEQGEVEVWRASSPPPRGRGLPIDYEYRLLPHSAQILSSHGLTVVICGRTGHNPRGIYYIRALTKVEHAQIG